ncbi:hypothetical protein LRR18_18580, partial [Mangrovimonas sp. AS39]|uniref:hypothetical protein n=1 Tax=Mangrovimonas futianensis TaxID=2895523 RepID=UPI001E4C1CB5
MAESLSLSREEIPQPFFACRTFADLAAIPEDATVPVVIYGDGNIGSLSPIGTVSFIRESHKLNPVI